MGLKLWEYYIRLPQDIIDDPKIDLSLNAFRLLAYLCRHQLRLGKAQIRMTQDEVLNGRKDPLGFRIDQGSRITGSRNLTSGREELMRLGWLKYFCLEGAWVYELIIQEHDPQVQIAPGRQVQIAPKAGANCTQNQVQIAPEENNKVLHKKHKVTQEGKVPLASPTEAAVGYHATLEAIACGTAVQPDLYNGNQASLVATSGEKGFNAVEVAHAMCVELMLTGQQHRAFFAELLTQNRNRTKKSFEKCGEDLLALWSEYQKLDIGEFAVGWKKFFADGIYAKKDKWKKAKKSSGSPGHDATALIKERKAQIGAKE